MFSPSVQAEKAIFYLWSGHMFKFFIGLILKKIMPY